VSKTEDAEQTQARNRPQQAGDVVDFSDTVSNLQRIEGQLKQAPEVDAERVAEVRARIESGEYEVDARSVASKLARLEQDLS
jgi:negative regulator of flagellin synthesis FlgM